jgi:regulatory protein
VAARPPQELSLRARALRHLARREYTRHELTQKLAPHAESPEEIEQILNDFTQRGWLSEKRAAEQMVHARRRRYGIARIRRDLQAKGVSSEVLSDAVAALQEGEFDAARAVWRRKYQAPPATAADRARQGRFLLGRGFSSEVINRLLRSVHYPDDEEN